ncbi:MAG: CBS domain-containing protein [Candidatus Omnitrophota bacterium]|nr:CBS domain-containing protein [Candidatus Omnitrophota bacterium]
MDLIVTHKNSDFDALSSLVAASKLYPRARLLLPGSQERSVRSFLSLIKDKVKIESEKTCRMDDVTRLVIVDNRHRSRIGIAAKLLDKQGVKVHVYDHHPRTRFDIKADKDVFKEVGATVSILLEILARKRKLSLSPLEATLMLLGIYEETGSLSYSTTTRLEVDMVSSLLEMGANLNAVSSYLNRELTGTELSTLIELLESIEIADINGINVAFAHVDADRLDGEMGTVVHKLQEVENYPVLFAMFRSHGRIKILARSRVNIIDVNKLLAHFNGAGHSSAASARIEDSSLSEVKEDILRIIGRMTEPEVYARDIMTFPVKTVSQEEKVDDVLEKLDRFGHKGAPVLNENAELTGMITLGDLKKALKHGMGHSRIKGYMSTPLITVTPGVPLYELRKILLEKDKGRIPVIKDNNLVGIVTRNDVLKKIHGAFFPEKPGEEIAVSNMSEEMSKVLPGKLMKLIRLIGAEGDSRGMNVFLVGGFVRDLLLGKENYDLDMVVEGNAIKFGRVLAEKIGGSLVVHRKFGTSTLVKEWPKWLGPSLHPDNKFKIDIATARKEVYERPAALPTVEFSSLRDDVYRRDFTINAMAVNINKKNFGLFLDFFGGMNDLRRGVIRVLHDKSFIDDPTRIFRAVRFEQRFGFSIETHTEYLITHAVKREMFRRTENQRIRDELILILKEKDPEKAVFRMRELHELRFIHPELVLKRTIGKTFSDMRRRVKWYEAKAAGKRQLDIWLMNLMVILDKLTAEQTEEVLRKFVFTRSVSIRLRSFKKEADKAIKKLSSGKRMMPSRIYSLLEPFSHEVTLCAMAKTKSEVARRRIRRFFTEYNGTTLLVKGEDIKREGVKPGPKYKKILRRILYKKLDGKLLSRKDEIGYMREVIGKGK